MPQHCGGQVSLRFLTKWPRLEGGWSSPDRRKDGLNEAGKLAQVAVGLEKG